MRSSVVRILLIFALLGPLAGLFFLMLFASIQGFLQKGSLELLFLWPEAYVFFAPFAYILGTIPAFLSGVFVWFVHRKNVRGEIFYVVFIGIAIGIAFDLYRIVSSDHYRHFRSLMTVRNFLPSIWVCLGATLTCWTIACWRPWRPRGRMPVPLAPQNQ